jgi:putative endonuclease
MKQYFVYILANIRNTVLYVGITNDLVRRVYEHKNKLVKGFSQKYNLTKLVYFEILEDPKTAITREKTIKNLLRVKKEKLINSTNPHWKDLYNKILSSR